MIELQVEQPVKQSASDTSSRFSVLFSQPNDRGGGNSGLRSYASTSQAPFPVSHRATLPSIQHRHRDSPAPAIRLLLPASRQIPPADPPPWPTPPLTP